MKCDQQQPCSKCQARGRECVYRSSHPVHGTRASASRRNASLASRSRNATASGSNLQTPAHTSSSPHAHDSIDHSFRQETSVPTNNAHYGYSSRIAGQYSEFSVSPPVPFDSVSVSSVSYASSTTATSDYTGNYHEPHPQFSFAQEAVQVQNQLNALFSNEMFDKFFNDPIPQDLSQHIGVDEFIVPEMGPRTSIPSTGVPLATNTGDVQPFMAAMERVDYEGFKALYAGDSGLETMATPQVPRYDLPMTPEMSEPTPSELQYYRKSKVLPSPNQQWSIQC